MLDLRKSPIIGVLRKVLIRIHYPQEVMRTCVRWYVAYPLSLRHIEQMMQERGVFVDHATVHRWAIKIVPVVAAVFRRRKHPVGKSWRMDETLGCMSPTCLRYSARFSISPRSTSARCRVWR